MPDTIIRDLIKAPVKFQHGYINDSEGNMITQIRGWGRLQYLPDAEQKQDDIGEFVAEAINEKLNRPAFQNEATRTVIRQTAKNNIEYAIIQCGGNTKNLNLDGLLDRLGF